MTGPPAPTARRRIPSFGRSVAQTAVFNVAATVAAGIAGIVIARALGPTVRGEYAAIMAWFGVVLVVGELGQTTATTYFVAHDRTRAADYLATSRNMMVSTGVIALITGIVAAPLLSAGNQVMTTGYRLVFTTCLACFVGASYAFGLQSINIPQWNVLRISQPVVFAVAIGALYLRGRLDLMSVLWTLTATVTAQAALSYLLCRAHGLAGGHGRLELARPMTRYGLGQLASSLPTMVTARLDQLVLSVTVVPTALGHYAVAASVTSVAVPVVAAVGYVAFPRIASRALSHHAAARLQQWAIVSSAAVGVVIMATLAGCAAWLVPAVFGPEFRASVPLVWLFAPAGVFLACGQVCGDLLRGHGRPFAVARAQIAAAATTVALLAVLLPLAGVAGAAITTSAAAGLALVLLLRALSHEARSRGPTPERTKAPHG